MVVDALVYSRREVSTLTLMLTCLLAVLCLWLSDTFFSSTKKKDRLLYFACSFCISWGFMILFGVFMLQFVNGIAEKRLIYCTVITIIGLGILYRGKYTQKSNIKQLVFLTPDVWDKKPCSKDNFLLKIRNIYTLCIISIFMIYGFLSASPVNWDSNTYNLSRTIIYVSQSSLFPSDTGSVRQLIMEIGHDILYWPDLVFFNTRGLGLLCSLEFIILIIACQAVLGIIFQKEDHLVSLRNQINLPRAFTIATILNITLLAASPQQVMQALITKNDLIIVTCLMLACALCINFCMYMKFSSNKSLKLDKNFFESILIQLAIAFIAMSQKGYGGIVLIPLLISILYISSLLPSHRYRLSLEWPLNASIVSIITFIFGFSSLMINKWVLSQLMEKHWNTFTIGKETQLKTWTTIDLSFANKLISMALNISRVAYQLVTYPFSSLGSKFQSIPIPNIFGDNFGTGGGSSYDLIREASHDSSYPSLLNLVLISVIIFFTILYFLITNLRRKNTAPLADLFAIPAITLYGSSTIATIAIFFNLTYQPWIARFLGSTYIPLYVMISALGGIFLAKASDTIDNQHLSLTTISLVVLLTISFSCFLSAVNTADPNLMLTKLARNYTNTSKSSSYEWWLRSHKGYSDARIKQHLKDLKHEKYSERTICYVEESWSFIPILLSTQNKSFSENNLFTISMDGKNINGVNNCPANVGGSDKLLKDNMSYIYVP